MSQGNQSPLSKLSSAKRAITRNLKKQQEQVNLLFRNETTPEVVSCIEAGLEKCQSLSAELNVVCFEMLGLLEQAEKSDEDIAKEEATITQDLESFDSWNWQKSGKLKAMKSTLECTTSHQSLLNTTFREPPGTITSSPKLPDIPAPKFDGELKNFTNWYALFENMFHLNERLEPVQKLYYLKSAMIGKAANLLTDFPLTNDAYQEAWNFIKLRFYNKRAIIGTHFHSLMNLPYVKSDGEIRSLLDQVNVILRGLKICDIDTDALSPFVTYIIATHLETRLRDDWENSVKNNSKYPSFSEISEFLQNRSFAYEGSHNVAPIFETNKITCEKDVRTEKVGRKSFNVVDSNKSTRKCKVCASLSHYISSCEKFLNKSVSDRYEIAKSLKLCTNCLRSGHGASRCNSSMCRKCNSRHHSLLHRDQTNVSSPVLGKVADSVVETVPTSLAAVSTNTVKLLQTAIVYVRVNSRFVKARVLLDGGSQPNLISSSFVHRNRVPVEKSASYISGIGKDQVSCLHSTVIEIHSRKSSFRVNLDVDIINRIPYTVESNNLKQFHASVPDLEFADDDYNYPYVDILIGIEHVNRCLLDEKRFVNDTCIQSSHFGWIVSGPLVKHSYCNLVSTCLEDQLRLFLKMEDIEFPAEGEESEHKACENFVKNTLERNDQGQFVMRLPKKGNVSELADTYPRAFCSLKIAESERYSSIFPAYIEFMREYEELGHMEPVPRAESSCKPVYYIPHQAVLRPESSTTKLRVVFNASARTKFGKSLNDILMVGPSIQRELFDILLNFRTHRIAFTADITKMYRCILIHPDDRDLQRILWRDNPNSSPKIYRLKTVTYGTATASYLATCCLYELAQQIKPQSPVAAEVIENSFYMDDLLTGANSVDEAITLRSTIHETLLSAHFPLRKYASNSEEFLRNIDPELVESSGSIQLNPCSNISVLGLNWQCTSDSCNIKVRTRELPFPSLTKRVVLSEISKVFDPLGLVSPVSIRGKLLMQEIWRASQTWDDPVTPEIETLFTRYYRDLQGLSNFSVPRAYSSSSNCYVRNLIGFCDASKHAYCSVVYIQTQSYDKNYEIAICCAKTRVAPMKQLTIPKLELMAAVQLTRLLSRICKNLNLPFNNIYAFSDSTVVLAWLKSPAKHFKVFVSNRVSFIKETMPDIKWSYVNTAENPADLATRGISTDSFLNNSLWTNGPDWLKHNFEDNLPDINVNIDRLPELKKTKDLSYHSFNVTMDESIISKFSSYNKLINVIAYILRFSRNCKTHSRTNHKHCNPSHKNRNEVQRGNCSNVILTPEERETALKLLIRISQHNCFNDDIHRLSQGKPLGKKSRLKHLNPFLDKDNILRVGGRLRNAPVSYDTKHLIILDRNCKFVELYASNLHKQFFHTTKSLLCNLIRSKYWIVNGVSRIVKKVVYNCVTCTRFKAQTAEQLMGDLPACRVTVSRPFAQTGVDLCGPFSVKCLGHRSVKFNKAYASIFICMITRSVHIEIVPNLSAEAFIAALMRFTSRRGVPKRLYSDNATNFVGARNFFDLHQNVIEGHCTNNSIEWSFIPPRSPHHGGIWEAAVKAAKFHFSRATNSINFTYDELVTLFTRVEGILNSRPLCYKVQSENDEFAVTPAHFLIGAPLHEVPRVDSSDVPLTKRLELHRQIISSFWHHWRSSYLAQLQRRAKWTKSNPNLQINDIVIIKDATAKPRQWPLGKVTKTYPGSDGRVRVADVQTAESQLRRPVSKLVPLPRDGGSGI